MAHTVQLQVNLCIVSARDLPKTDLLSSIDGYITFTPPKQTTLKTKVVDNKANPSWNSDFTFMVDYDPIANTLPKLTFDLWDQNSLSKDQKVGTAELQLLPAHLQNPGRGTVEISFQHNDSKHSKYHSVLVLRFGEYAYSCQSLFQLVSTHISGVTFNPHGLGRLYIPLSFGPVVMALEYEKTCADLKLYITDNSDFIFLDAIRVAHNCSKVRRRRVTTPFPVFQGIHAYEEVKMNDIPFSVLADPGKVLFFLFKKTLLTEINLATIVTEHGWSGAMNWDSASKKLRNVELDKKEEEIFMKRDDSFIVVDFDEDNVDMKCLVLDTPANSNTAYDFTYTGNDVKKTSEIYAPPRQVLGGKYSVQRKLELDDVPYGTPFNKMVWYKYSVDTPLQISLFDVAKVHPF